MAMPTMSSKRWGPAWTDARDQELRRHRPDHRPYEAEPFQPFPDPAQSLVAGAERPSRVHGERNGRDPAEKAAQFAK